jgi:uncharacterized protein (DUF885 family)
MTAPIALALLCAAASPFEQSLDAVVQRKANAPETQRLHELFDLAFTHENVEHPETATFRGVPGQNDRWTDLSPDAIARRKEDARALLRAARSIERSKLAAADQLNYELFLRNAEDDVDEARFPGEFLALSQLSGPQYLSNVFEVMPAKTARDYLDILARLRGIPSRIAQTQALLARGLAAGVTPPKVVLRDVPAQLEAQTPAEPLQSPLLKPFRKLPETIAPAEREKLQAAAVQVYRERLVPAYTKLREYLVATYLPKSRESVGFAALPDGAAWYAQRVRRETTTKLTPQQIHALGLSEVKRIRGEMDKIIAQTGFKGTFADFSKFLRTDPRFFYTDAQSLVSGYRDIAKRIDPELVKIFGKLPRLTYGVIEIPAFSARSQTTAYYRQGSPEAMRAGSYFVNTYALDTRPKWEMEALTLHESVPGHHLQIALEQELENVPRFRHYTHYVAFTEGWGLYAESLGAELGLYQDPYSRYGQLTYEMWRAIRLVVDTGMHALGWSREQAIDYFKENSAKTEHDITVEIDRYLVMAGQALAYKIGELKIKELRAAAAQELGARFDERAFHDAVLGNGSVPLELLESQVRAFIAREKGQKG